MNVVDNINFQDFPDDIFFDIFKVMDLEMFIRFSIAVPSVYRLVRDEQWFRCKLINSVKRDIFLKVRVQKHLLDLLHDGNVQDLYKVMSYLVTPNNHCEWCLHEVRSFCYHRMDELSLCQTCNESKQFKLLTQTESIDRYKVPKHLLLGLPHTTAPNPHYKYAAPTKLFRESQVEDLSKEYYKLYGGLDGFLEAKRLKKEASAAKRQKAKIGRLERICKALGVQERDSILGQSWLHDYIHNGVGKVGNLIEITLRYLAVRAILMGLGLPSDKLTEFDKVPSTYFDDDSKTPNDMAKFFIIQCKYPDLMDN